MSELPKGWVEVAVGDVAESMLGKMLDKAKRVTGTMQPYLRNLNVRWDAVDLNDVYEMPFENDEHDRFGLLRGDLLICEGGEPGRAAVWDGSRPGMKFQKAIHRVRASAALLPRLLLHRLRADANTGDLEEYFTGTTIKHFTGVSLERYRIPLPPLNEQRRIVEKLDAVFEKSRAAKARLERLSALLEKLKRSILAAAFRGDLTKDWRAAHPDVEPASALLERIRAERRRRWEEGLRAKGKDPKKATYEEPAPFDVAGLPELPEGWAWAMVGDLALANEQAVLTGPFGSCLNSEDFTGEGVPVLTIGCLTDHGISLAKAAHLPPAKANDLARYLLRAGDMLFSRMASVGRAGFVTQELSGSLFNYHLMRLRLDPEKYRPYLFLEYVRGAPAVRRYLDDVNHGATRDGINTEQLLACPVAVPPAPEQVELESAIGSALESLRLLAARIVSTASRVGRLEQAALAKAFRGELVQQDPTDEPASVLLARIRAARADAPQRIRRGFPATGRSATAPKPRPKSPSAAPAEADGGLPADLVAAAFQQAKRLTATAIGEATGLDGPSIKKALKELVDAGQVRVEGRARGTRYEWVG